MVPSLCLQSQPYQTFFPCASAPASHCLTFPCCSGQAQGQSDSRSSCVCGLGNFRDLFLTFQTTVDVMVQEVFVNYNEYLGTPSTSSMKKNHASQFWEMLWRCYFHATPPDFSFILKLLHLKSGLLNGPLIFYHSVISCLWVISSTLSSNSSTDFFFRFRRYVFTFWEFCLVLLCCFTGWFIVVVAFVKTTYFCFMDIMSAVCI